MTKRVYTPLARRIIDFWRWEPNGTDYQLTQNGTAMPVKVVCNPQGWNDYYGGRKRYGRPTIRPWAAEVNGRMLMMGKGATIKTWEFPESAMVAARRMWGVEKRKQANATEL